MRQDLTDITLVVDRSGSMKSCLSDAEGGINHFIEEQKTGDGDAVLTLVQFDNEYEFVHSGVPVSEVPSFRLRPRGGTALLDAVGRAINEAGERLDKMPEDQRPGCVVFVIVTDGHENASKEFTQAQVRELITNQRDAYNWQFTFLGADEKAFDEAVAMGISRQAVATYDPARKSGEAHVAASSNVSRMRSAALSGEKLSCSFTSEERTAMS